MIKVSVFKLLSFQAMNKLYSLAGYVTVGRKTKINVTFKVRTEMEV